MIKNTFILLLAACSLFAQGTILRGRVLDAGQKTPLVSASILLKPSLNGNLSDAKGAFELPLKSAHDNLLQISYIGYETLTIPINKFSLTDTLLILLHRVALPSQSIIVSASALESDRRNSNFQKIERAELEKSRANEDVPELLSSLPSTQWYSEGGAANGYNYLSIRGFDQRRIAVMVNGIPQNDPEDHNVYWIDFSDILGSSEALKVQRGSGAGMFGYPAIGGAINIVTSAVSAKPEFIYGMEGGSYGLKKYSASYSTGLIDGKYSVQARFAKTSSSGYRDYSATDVTSYYLSMARFDDNLVTQVNIYGGPFEDQLVYTGLPKSYVTDKTLRKLNYSDWDMGSNGYIVPRRAEENEQFTQPHYEILQDWKISKNVTLNSALFYITGSGYYDYDGSWANYTYFRLTPQNGFTVNGNPEDNYIANAIIRAQVENKQWGWIPRVKAVFDQQEINAGLELRFHRSDHWGSLASGNGAPPEVTPDFHYYEYRAGKDMLGAFVNDCYSLSSAVKLIGELQLSYTKYLIYDEKFIGNDFTVPNVFLNPKIGINYTLSDVSSAFFTISRVSREPRLSNYYDAGEASGGAVPQFQQKADGSYDFSNPLVKPEHMLDLELGYGYFHDNFSASVNCYLMTFTDEIVKNGGVDRFGEPTTGNMDRTRHIGVEVSVRYGAGEMFDLFANATLSKNTVTSGYYYATINGVTQNIDLSGNRITASPDFIGNFGIMFHTCGFFAELTGNYVGAFYSDNFDSKAQDMYSTGVISYDDNKNDAYFTAKLFASYSFRLDGLSGDTKLFGELNNIFNKLYSAFAVGKEFFPAAERNFVIGIKTAL